MSKINNWMLKKYAAVQLRKAEAEEGQGLVEYGLILALISVICIIALQALGGGVVSNLGKVTSALTAG